VDHDLGLALFGNGNVLDFTHCLRPFRFTVLEKCSRPADLASAKHKRASPLAS
jgi:hypothetical protein